MKKLMMGLLLTASSIGLCEEANQEEVRNSPQKWVTEVKLAIMETFHPSRVRYRSPHNRWTKSDVRN